MPGLQRDPLSVRFDPWARELLELLKADPWEWHARLVKTPRGVELLGEDHGGLTHSERAVQRSLWYCLGHAASSGLKIRPEWSLQVSWDQPRYPDPEPGQPYRIRQRILRARVTPKDAARRAVLLRGRSSYIGQPTSRGARPGETWQPKE